MTTSCVGPGLSVESFKQGLGLLRPPSPKPRSRSWIRSRRRSPESKSPARAATDKGQRWRRNKSPSPLRGLPVPERTCSVVPDAGNEHRRGGAEAAARQRPPPPKPRNRVRTGVGEPAIETKTRHDSTNSRTLASDESAPKSPSAPTRSDYIVHVGRHAFMDSHDIRDWFAEDKEALLAVAADARAKNEGEQVVVVKVQTTAGSALKIASLLNEPHGRPATVEQILQHGTTELLIANISMEVLAGLFANNCLRLQSLAADGLRRIQVAGQPFTVYLTSGMTPVNAQSLEVSHGQHRKRSMLIVGERSPRRSTFTIELQANDGVIETNGTVSKKSEVKLVVGEGGNDVEKSTEKKDVIEKEEVASHPNELENDSFPELSAAQLCVLHKSFKRKPSVRRVPIVPHWNEKLLRRVARLVAEDLSPTAVQRCLPLTDFDVVHLGGETNVDQIFQMLQVWQRSEKPEDTCSILQELVEENRDIGGRLDEMFAAWKKNGEFLPGFITDDPVDEIAQQVGPDWRNLAFELHMTSADIDHLTVTHDEGSEEDEEDAGNARDKSLARRMILHWRRTSGRYATRHILAEALCNADLGHLVDHLRIEQRSGQALDKPQLTEFVRGLMRQSTKRATMTQGVMNGSQRRRRLAKKRITATNLRDIPAVEEAQADYDKAQSSNSPPPSSPNEILAAPVVISTPPWEAVSDVKSGPYFGVDLDELPGRSDGSIVPLFIDKCIAFVEERGMASRGIYRVSGAGSAVNELLDIYTKDHNLDFFTLDPARFDENTIASALKSFLRKLPEPIVPKAVTDKLAEVPALATDKQLLIDRLKLIVYFGMPELNRSLLAELCKHFHRVTQHAEDNCMKASNLGIVFWPTLTRPEFDSNDLVLMRDLPVLLQHAVTILIESCEEIFCDVPLKLQ